MTEILAPAGNEECFFAAINGGANAVYLGLDLFSARKSAQNFTRDNLPFYITYAHLLGVKVYVALNTISSDKELSAFLAYASFCNDNAVDAVIVQDMFLGKLLSKAFPKLELHLSTQAGVNNVYGAKLAKDYGFSRVVLARETPLSEIRKISQIVETEAFIQGALCTAFSGQCYASSFAGNNSGNRGLCKQPCRKKYTLKNEKGEKSGYLISLADLSVGKNLADFLGAGVTSLKIEGRMRKPSYVYYTTDYYKNVLDGQSPSISPLSRSFKRGNYTKGLAYGQDENLISDKVQSHIGEEIGKIRSVNGKQISVSATHKFTAGDSGKIIRNGLEVGNYTVSDSLKILYQGSPKSGDLITLTLDAKLERDYLLNKKSLPISLLSRFFADKQAEVTAYVNGKTITVNSDFILEKASNRPLSKEELSQNLAKCGEYPFSPTVSVETDGVFIAKSQLNAFRRLVYENIVNELAPIPKKPSFNFEINNQTPIADSNSLLIIDENFEDIKDFKFDVAVFCPKDYHDESLFEKFFIDLKNNSCKKFLYLPPLYNTADNGLIGRLLKNFDGIYVDGYYGVELAKEYNTSLILGCGTNIFNSVSAKAANEVASDYVVSKELTLSSKNGLGGYYLSGGSIKVMDLCYCPFNKDCAKCKGADYSFLSDGERDYTLRRYKLNGCRFQVFNPYPLLTDGANKSAFNFITLNKTQKIALLNNVFRPINAKLNFPDYTTGHSKKPLN